MESLCNEPFNQAFARTDEVGLLKLFETVLATKESAVFTPWKGSLISSLSNETIVFAYPLSQRAYTLSDLISCETNENELTASHLQKAIANREFIIH